ncbi:MAG TPA: Mpo1-like protein [Burkholderiaceae bacterium]
MSDQAAATQRQIDQLLAQYSESHLHPTNEIIHFICVPAIVFSLLGMLWALHPGVAVGVTVVSLVYYCMLSVPFALGMVLMSGAMLAVLSMLPPPAIFPLSLAVFVVAWIAQFVGHKIEGKKPSFFDDLRFLLIGPLFVLSFLYRRLKIAF